MKGLNKKYPMQDFEFNNFGLGHGKIVAYNLQGLLAGLEYATENGWEIQVESNKTVEFGSFKEVAIFNPTLEAKDIAEAKEQQTQKQQEEENPVDTEDSSEIEEQEDIVDLEALSKLSNNKNNREKIDDIAKGLGVELDRRKLRSVEALVNALKEELNKE